MSLSCAIVLIHAAQSGRLSDLRRSLPAEPMRSLPIANELESGANECSDGAEASGLGITRINLDAGSVYGLAAAQPPALRQVSGGRWTASALNVDIIGPRWLKQSPDCGSS